MDQIYLQEIKHLQLSSPPYLPLGGYVCVCLCLIRVCVCALIDLVDSGLIDVACSRADRLRERCVTPSSTVEKSYCQSRITQNGSSSKGCPGIWSGEGLCCECCRVTVFPSVVASWLGCVLLCFPQL